MSIEINGTLETFQKGKITHLKKYTYIDQQINYTQEICNWEIHYPYFPLRIYDQPNQDCICQNIHSSFIIKTILESRNNCQVIQKTKCTLLCDNVANVEVGLVEFERSSEKTIPNTLFQ